MFARRLFAALLLASSLGLGPSVLGSPSKAQQSNPSEVAAPRLRSIDWKYKGFDDANLNDSALQEQEEYVKKFLKNPPHVEEFYNQEKVDETKKLVTAFWKQRGVTVQVHSTLTPIPETHAARLHFVVQR
jgi:hypothetical protein